MQRLIGKTITAAAYAYDDGGYPFVRLEFADGSQLCVIEYSQSGEIRVHIDNSKLPKPEFR